MKILMINTVEFSLTGIPVVVMNYLRNLDKKDLNIHVVAIDEPEQVYLNEFSQMKISLHIYPRKKDLFAYMRQLFQLICQEKIDVVHIHGNSGTMAIDATVCKLAGAKKIIVHGHSMTTKFPVVNAVLKPIMNAVADVRLGCSEDACRWLYGNKPYTVIKNAIELDKYEYNEDIRNRYREEFGLKNAYVVGHVGQFTELKNQEFLVRAFCSVHEKNSNVKLLLIGNGERQRKIRDLVTELNIEDVVIFTGDRADVANIYQAMDVFAFPSKSEGFGLVLIEAQASGVKCIASDAVPNTTKIDMDTEFLSIENPEIWARKIEESITLQRNRYLKSKCNKESLKNLGFDIKHEAQHLKSIYLER